MLTIDLAYRMRYERGTIPPLVDDFETEELKKMVIRYNKLNDEMDRLDEKLYEMYNSIDLDKPSKDIG